MNRNVTLGGLLTVFIPVFLMLAAWMKTHEDRQDEKTTQNTNYIIQHEERIVSLEEFKEDIKLFQEKQDKNHIETLEAISGLTTSIEVLIERNKHTGK